MKYIINNNIIYHDDKSELSTRHDDLSLQPLTLTLNRLLSILIENNNHVVPRETLLNRVWELHGQVASNNNLNNAVSSLRKVLAGLGEDDLIVTVPRQGFMLSANELEIVEHSGVAESLTVGRVACQAEKVVGKRRYYREICAGLLMLLIMGGGIYAWLMRDVSSLHAIKVGNIGRCEVKFLSSYYKPGVDDVDLAYLKTLLKQQEKEYCNSPATLFYYDNAPLLKNMNGQARHTYIYYCPNKKMAIEKSQCENLHEIQNF
ncbi:TPA: hypothetical protein JHJ70_003609 [Serratia marcescens]|nr:hypothetical protein [Serratia marcescens]HAV2137651.1 hypothetical protein [Serratia marcescens]